MSVSGLNSIELSTYNLTNIPTENQLYHEDSQALSENVQAANPSSASGLNLLQPVSPLLNAGLSAVNTLQEAQAAGVSTLNQQEQAANVVAAQAANPVPDPGSANVSVTSATAAPQAQTSLLQNFQQANQAEAQQAYAAQQAYSDDNGTLADLESLVA
jgi:hypothetical protein